jgi:bifunctional NMN adenylyltransferase/nudix hydrolase
MAKINDYDIGVVIGRFQIPTIHEAHRKIIQEVINRHRKVIIFVGVSPTLGTKEHPLDFVNRKLMLEKEFSGVVVLPLLDINNDKIWSDNLDTAIRTTFPQGSVVLYGGRDSFVKHYSGKFDAYEFPTHDYRPATEIRAEIGKSVISSDDFRAGIIYSTQNQFKRTHLTIDVLLYDKNKGVLLGRKKNESKLRFIGGFVEGDTLEEAVRKESMEEANAEIDNLQFLGSSQISDWRYSHTSDSVLTSLFAAEVNYHGVAGDDLVEIQWVPFLKLYLDYNLILVGSHSQLFQQYGKDFVEQFVDKKLKERKK